MAASLRYLVGAIRQAICDPGANWQDASGFEPEGQLFTVLSDQISSITKASTDTYIAVCGFGIFTMMPVMQKNGFEVEEFRKFDLDKRFATLRPFADRSWSATSKFLFFYRPDRYFIWDSRVARAINRYLPRGRKFAVTCGEDYRRYCGAIRAVMADRTLMAYIDGRFPAVMVKDRIFNGGRKIEAALYVVGRKG